MPAPGGVAVTLKKAISDSKTLVARAIDLRDVFYFSGLAAACVGMHAIYPPAAWILCGAALMWKAR